MSEKVLKNLYELTASIEANRDRVRCELAKAGSSDPDPAFVTSAAKYHQALQMLADE
jgi:hypothetical protein